MSEGGLFHLIPWGICDRKRKDKLFNSWQYITKHCSGQAAECGVEVVDLKTNTKFKLDGALKVHPIDIAGDECESRHSSTIGIKNCKKIVLEAWDHELNRAYKALGGSDNSELKAAQLAWIEFRDRQITYLKSEYGARNGTIWGIVYMSHVVSLTKEQAQRLQSVK